MAVSALSVPRPAAPPFPLGGPEAVAVAPPALLAPRGPTRRRPIGPRPLLPESPALFGWLARRFSEGEATLWIGPEREVARLLELTYAGVALAGGTVSLLEGSNRLDPYKVAEAGRSLGLDATRLLPRIRLARAFTAYQMVALVDGWARETARSRPSLVVGHGLPELFEGEELPEEERAPLLGHIAQRLRELGGSVGCPMLLTLTGPPTSFPGLAERGPRLFDLVRIRRAAGGDLRLDALRDGRGLALVPRPDGQRGLEEFAAAPGGEEEREEVIRWAGRLPPTERRSRSG